MASPIATSLRTILPYVTAQLVSVTGVTSNRVLLCQRDKVPHFQGDQDILVRVSRPLPEEGFSVGSGRHANIISRMLQVTPRTRWAVDESDRDDYFLLDSTSGHLKLEEAVIDALHIWVPTDSSSNWLTMEPIHWKPSADPVRETPDSDSYGHTDLLFHIRYQLSHTSNGY